MIAIHNLNKSFGRLGVLKGIDCCFDQGGTISAILGPNGSGKTTLIKSILGMVLPDSGRIEVFGRDIRRQHSYRDRISYLPQIARFPENLRVHELIAMVQDLHKRPGRPEPLIHRFGLEPWLDKPLGTLSGGTRQKVNLVLAFMYDNPILILDEPTAGLDPVAIIRLKEMLEEARAAGKIILLTTHIMSLVEDLADEVVFLLDGQVRFRDSVAALKAAFDAASVERAIASLLLQNGHASSGMQAGAPVSEPSKC